MKLSVITFLLSSLVATPCMADPTISNVRASQRAGTRLVDIYYDVVSPLGPVAVTVEVSADGGATYLIPAASMAGDVGAGVAAGVDKHVVWNAGIDRPGRLSPAMRFRVCVDDGLPPDSSFDVDALAYFNRSLINGDIVTPTARLQLDLFIRECKRVGYWGQMVYVPCRHGYGALNTLGGAPQRTNAKFIRQGVTTQTARGVEFIPGDFYQNRVQLPFDWPVAQEPLFVGVLGFAGSGPALVPYGSFLRWNYGTTSNLLGTYAGSDVYGLDLVGFSTPGSYSAEYRVDDYSTRTTRKPNFAGAAFDGGHTLRCVLGSQYEEITHATATTGRPVGPVYFVQPAATADTHVVQGCVLFYGSVSALPMKSFFSLVSSTLLEDSWGRFVYLHIGGQSNASDFIYRQLWMEPNSPQFQVSRQSFGGQYISYWLGTDPLNAVRSPAYQTAKNSWLGGKPLSPNSKWDAPYFWVQGESDTEYESMARVYGAQLVNLARFLRSDLRPDLQLAIGGIDYAVAYRTAAANGNFQLTGCAGAAAGANGTWAIVAHAGLAEANATYEWANGIWHCTREPGGQWKVHANGVTYFMSASSEMHPVTAAAWTGTNGAAGTPTVGESRTGNIELVRKAQRDFTTVDGNAFWVDSRGCERSQDTGGGDAVHMTSQGYKTLSDRFAAAFTLARRP
jgi:hypothetical protein